MSVPNKIPLIKVRQWLSSWDQSDWCKEGASPPKEFYVGSVSISFLRRLAGVGHRKVEDRRQAGSGVGYQRAHQSERSKKIARYMQYGYPLSSQAGLDVEEHSQLVHPGWLPTSILVNVLHGEDERRRKGERVRVSPDRLLTIEHENGADFLMIPESYRSQVVMPPADGLEPVEVIDGQHRLYAVDAAAVDGEEDYEVPVVFFDGMSLDQQAYLFWVINVEPKKINPSLAFDLYPELRSKSWLESGEGIKVYQEHRAQELTEVLWRHPLSPWGGRIELHGNRVAGHVSNAAFIRSLMASFVRRWGAENRIGGFFGSINGSGEEYVIPWNRSQQAAYLIACWTHVHDAVRASEADWVNALRSDVEPAQAALGFEEEYSEFLENIPFSGGNSLLATDQGCRAVLVVFNAMSQVAFDEIELERWAFGDPSDEPDNYSVADAFDAFMSLDKANDFLKSVAEALVDGGVDWRTSSAPGLSRDQQRAQGAYRGGSGYKSLQVDCFKSLANSDVSLVERSAATVIDILGIN